MLTLKIRDRFLGDRLLLIAMILSLHAALLAGLGNLWVHPLLLTHLGLFLLWQPIWRGESRVGGGALAIILLAAVVVIFWLTWWAIGFWLTGLFGLVGARIFVFRDRRTRLLYLSLLAYLLVALLLWVVPNMFADQSTIGTGHILIWYVLPVLLLLMAAVPLNKETLNVTQTVDFVYGLMLFMLLTLMVLGTLAFMTLGRMDYFDGLLRTLFLMGLVLLALGLLWNPRFGFTGLQVMFSRYLLNVGTPFESWLAQLTEAAQREADAKSYLRRATALLEDFSWLSGFSWQSPEDTGQYGDLSEHFSIMNEGGLRLTLYSKQSLNPTLLLHIQLLVKLIGYFYQAKQREQNLRDIARLQAVYETGSRLTHDLKNMLQSLLSLSLIAQSREERSQQLLQQQLPVLTQRFEKTLVKLKQPLSDSEAPKLPLNVWWNNVKLRNHHQAIEWRGPEKLPGDHIPAPLFDCITDNLIDNAVKKRQSDSGITIVVEIQPDPLRLIACDTGKAIPENIAANLLRGTVVSQNGLGIGMYQAARWASQSGYRLSLISNRPGKVCFELAVEQRRG